MVLNFLNHKVHQVWLLTLASLAIVVGVWLSAIWRQSWFAPLVWLVIGLLLVALSLYFRIILLIPLAIVGGLMIGLWRGSGEQAELDVWQKLIGQQLTIRGQVLEDIDQNSSGLFVARLGHITIEDRPISGSIWLTFVDKKSIWRSDFLTVSGKLTQGFGSFSAAIYRAKINKLERPEPGDVALKVRNWFAGLVQKSISEPESSLALGFLLGQRRALPPDLNDSLRTVGLTHVIVASGYNLTILVRFGRRLFAKIGRREALFGSIFLVISFMAITGLSPSMSRAGLVTGLSLVAWYFGRKFHPLVLICIAAAVTVLFNPSYIWNDLGWQLSFASFAGVIILAPLLQAYFFGSKKPSSLRQILGETLSAQIATLPIIMLAFGEFSSVALIANLLVLPFVPLAMLLTFLSGIGTLIWLDLGSLIGQVCDWLLSYMLGVIDYLAQLPWAMQTISFDAAAALFFYIILAGTAFYFWRKTDYNLSDSNIVE